MCAKDRRSRDQKRRAKLATRPQNLEPAPARGTKYQSDRWVPHVYATERAIYEGILASQQALTNAQVKEAFVRLIRYLDDGQPAPLADGEPDVPYATGNEVPFLIGNIRLHWRTLFVEQGFVSSKDLVGILRTLLNSIEAHAWNTGPDRGYVAFLYEFMGRMEPTGVGGIFAKWTKGFIG